MKRLVTISTFALMLGTSSLLFAESVDLSNLPPLPEDAILFEEERQFGYRGRIGGFELKPSKYGIYFDKDIFYEKTQEQDNQSVKIMYIRGASGFCGAYIVLMADLSDFVTMSFMIKGEKGGESFELGINDTISNKREDAVIIGSISRFLPQGVTTSWQRVDIPLSDFYGTDLSNIFSIIFLFNEEGKGTFWIDDIRMHKKFWVGAEEEIYKKGFLLLDDFDHSDLNLLGRKTNTYKKLPSVCKFERVTDVHLGNAGRSLKLIYNKEPRGWCGYYTLLNQIDGEYYDLTKYKSLSFWVRGEKGGETFEIGMADKNWLNIGDSLKAGHIEKYLPGGVTTQWQQVIVPLEEFGALDLSQMGSFVINFNKKQKGVIYIDDIKFYLKETEKQLEGLE